MTLYSKAADTNDKFPAQCSGSAQTDKDLTMMTTTTLKRHRPSPAITADEEERRRQHVASAYSHNRIEGIMPDPEGQPIFEAYISGEIDVAELGQRIDALVASR
jgi:hypothetical protein